MKLYTDDSTFKKKLGQGLKRARKAKGYTQQELADELDSTLISVRNWEQGIVEPKMSTLHKLCRFYECDLDYLCGNIDCKTEDVQFIHDYTGLSEDAINKLHSYLEPFDGTSLYRKLKGIGYSPKDIAEMIEEQKNSYETSLEREYNDILSLIIEDISYDYLLSLITAKIKLKKPMTPKERLQNDVWIDHVLPDGSSVVVDKRNLFDNLITSQLPLTLSAISEVYHSSNSDH